MPCTQAYIGTAIQLLGPRPAYYMRMSPITT
jgi:hypothetical protein